MLVIDIKEINESNGFIVGRTIVNGDNKECAVRVINVTEQPKMLKKGDLLGGVEEIDELYTNEMETQIASDVLPSYLQELYDQTVRESKIESDVANSFKEFLKEHRTVFAENDCDLGRTELVQHNIETTNALPIRQPPRRLPIAQQKDCEKEIKSMLEKKVIEPGQSPWASPVVLVKKKDGSLRFCVDYRKLNSVTKFDAYPLPRIDETLESLGGARWFTTLDLLSGYWQVGLTPEAKIKSAFCVRSSLYVWSVTPFGLFNAPSTFERLMETVLQGLQWSSCLVYLDDVVIFGNTQRELLERMDEVFTRLRKAGLKIKPRKCKFFQTETNYLGHIISGEGVKVSPEKVAAVRDWPIPQCVIEVRSFLGAASYYRGFILGFASIAVPLHDLTKLGVKFEWTDACQHAFESLKTKLCDAPVLSFPVKNAQFVLDTDASDCGIGGVLSQLIPITDDNGEIKYEERVLSYASRTLNIHENRYCTTRKELLAVVWFMRYFRPYLYGQEFVVRSDHASLQWLCSFWEPEGQIARWLQLIGEYTFKSRT